jgi:hypothetical protein
VREVTSSADDAANRPRYAGRAGYDAWYVTLSDPDQGVGAWLRWTAMLPHPGAGGDAHSALWAFVLHRGRPDLHAGIRQVSAYESRFRDLHTGDITSEGRTARWDLAWVSQAAPFAYAGRGVERFLPTGNVMAHPRLAVTGAVELDGRRYSFKDAGGGQGHTWGSAHAPRWNWVHAALPNGWVTGASTPLGSPYGAEIDGRRRSRTGVAAVLARGDQTSNRWSADDIEVTADLDDCVAVEYQDPTGGRRVCYHSEFGRMTIGGQLVSTSAAFEYASSDALPGRPPIRL